jgi:hypothetical protein
VYSRLFVPKAKLLFDASLIKDFMLVWEHTMKTRLKHLLCAELSIITVACHVQTNVGSGPEVRRLYKYEPELLALQMSPSSVSQTQTAHRAIDEGIPPV